MVRLSDVADWFNSRNQTAFAVLFLISVHLFLISVNTQNNCHMNVSLFTDACSKEVL